MGTLNFDALTEVTRKEQSVRAVRAKSGKKLQIRDAEILCLVHHGKLVRRMLALDNRVGNSAEYGRRRNLIQRRQRTASLLEYGPQGAPLLFGQPSLPAQAGNVAIRIPCLELPCIDNLLPFLPQEMQRETVASGLR